MRFRVRDLLIADVPGVHGFEYPCAPDTVCGTITHDGPGGNTCMDSTHCCYTAQGCSPVTCTCGCTQTGCGSTGCGQTCVGGTYGVVAEAVAPGGALRDEFTEMLRREVQEIQSKSKEAVYDAPEPETIEDLTRVEAKLVAALDEVRGRLKKR